MKYSFFLIAILVVGIFLPQDAVAQRRGSKVSKHTATNKKNVKKYGNKVKRTGSAKKVRVRSYKPVTLNANLLNAIVVPRCNEGNDHLAVQILNYPVITQNVLYKDNKLQARKLDGSLSSEKTDFISQQDFILATKLVDALHPTEMEFYPSSRSKDSTYISFVVLVKDKWGPQDADKVYQILKVLLEPTIPVSLVPGECVSGAITDTSQP